MSGFDEPAVALLERRGRFLVAAPFFGRGPRLVVERGGRGRPGDLVLLRGAGRGRARGGGHAHGRARPRGRAQVERVIGRGEGARDRIGGQVLERGLARSFPAGVEREARGAQPDAGVARSDLRELPTFTIDPASARDFDDALSCEQREPGRWRAWVHIADVAAHVRQGSQLDREAQRRATSVYAPGAVEPMLPAALSNGACSLLPGEERLAVSVEMDFHGARVERVAFHRSLIRSDARLDYDRVDRIFAGAESAAAPWDAPLAATRALAAELQRARERRGALAVESVEPRFAFDREGHVVALEGSAQTESHRLVEHLMIAANEQVATLLEQRSLPALYRIHERPDATRVERLVEQLDSLEVPTPPLPERLSPQQAGELAAEASRLVDAHVRRAGHGRAALTGLVLRALQQARYQPRNVGHHGLSAPRYCHFTSPIRRYPDLVCHRALLSAVGGGERPPAASGMQELGAWCSQRERDAMAIERDCDDVARCFLLERELLHAGWEREFDGEVVGLAPVGAFVALREGYEGLMPVRRMRGDWWELNELETMLVGTRSGSTVRLGDELRVRVERIEAPRGRVDLVPVENGP